MDYECRDRPKMNNITLGDTLQVGKADQTGIPFVIQQEMALDQNHVRMKEDIFS